MKLIKENRSAVSRRLETYVGEIKIVTIDIGVSQGSHRITVFTFGVVLNQSRCPLLVNDLSLQTNLSDAAMEQDGMKHARHHFIDLSTLDSEFERL